MLRKCGAVSFFPVGSELILFGCEKETYEFICRKRKDSKITGIHVFLTKEKEEEYRSLAKLIRSLQSDTDRKHIRKINLYGQNSKICEYLWLQQISPQWYNFFINIWDEIVVDGLAKPLEYMFYQNKENENLQQYAVEIVIPKQGSLYYCESDPMQPFERGVVYDEICYVIKKEHDYEKLLELTKDRWDVRKKISLCTDGAQVKEDRFVSDGFMIVTKEE